MGRLTDGEDPPFTGRSEKKAYVFPDKIANFRTLASC